MTLNKLYELVIHMLIYGMVRVDDINGIYTYYGVSYSSVGTLVLEYYNTSYVLKTYKYNTLIYKYN